MNSESNILDAVNRSTYAQESVVRCYDKLDFIHQPEAVIFEKLLPDIKDEAILDIGIGGGRTTTFLLEISKRYTGIDYTPACVAAARARFPTANIMSGDARDLSAFNDATFAFVLFSFNSIDYVSHEDRLQVLREIRRVLKPGGHFAFSTHNRDCREFNKLPWQSGVEFNLPFFKNCLYALRFLPKHLSMRRHEVHTDEYAIINDNAHGFSLLTYYIGIECQKAQLESVGFANPAVYDMDGKEVESDQRFPWTYYLTQKG